MDSVKMGDDLKQLLKQLFIEKKRVRELESKLGTKGELQLADLQNALAEREGVISHLESQLGKTRPALKQLFEQLQEAKERLQESPSYRYALEEKEKDYQALVQEFKELKGECAALKATHDKDIGRFESERARLVEKLAESLSQHQRHSDTVKDLHDEINRLRQNNLEIKQHLEKGQIDLAALIEQKQSDSEQIQSLKGEILRLEGEETLFQRRVKELEARFSETDLAAIHKEYRDQVEELQKRLEQAEGGSREGELVKKELEHHRVQLSELTEAFKQLQEKARRLEHANEERANELRQSQHHLAKKLKELTLLRDLSEEQKEKIGLLEQELVKLTAELHQSKHLLSLQKIEEEKRQLVSEQWRDKFNEQAVELAASRDEIERLQKIKRQHDEMAAKFAEVIPFIKNNI